MKNLYFVLFFTGFVCFAAFARDITITAVDADLDIALEGAVVNLPDGAKVTANRQGRAVVTVPDGRETLLRITYPGYETYRILIPANGESSTITAAMRMGTMMENKELVIEADKTAGGVGTQAGRSVSISGDSLRQTAQIGVMEDVMTAVKLLPGVSYTSGGQVSPSIRGGEPGDIMAVYDGYYVTNPYFWGGQVSIFDPRAVEKAQLSHGVFSSRFGYTTSGLLELTSRSGSREVPEFEIGMSTTTANLNMAYPLWGKGSVMAMGKITYFDPVFWIAKELSKYDKTLDPINAFDTAPYIRAAALSAGYDIMDNLKIKLNGFVGADGVGLDYNNENDATNTANQVEETLDKIRFKFDYKNFKGFVTTQLTWSPAPPIAANVTFGAGVIDGYVDGDVSYNQWIDYNENFGKDWASVTGLDYWRWLLYHPTVPGHDNQFRIDQIMHMDLEQKKEDLQGRIDIDYNIGYGFVAALGVQELFTRFSNHIKGDMMAEIPVNSLGQYITDNPELAAVIQAIPPELQTKGYISRKFNYPLDTENSIYNTAGYILGEWTSPQKRLSAELGLRVDHVYLSSKAFNINTIPAVEPRFNVDYTLFEDKGIFDKLALSVGSGLFTSMTDNLYVLQTISNPDTKDDITPKQNKSWASILGLKLEFLDFYSLTFEAYYKYGFDRAYGISIPNEEGELKDNFFFDGQSHIFGFDFMIQKFSGRLFDGWLTYSFNYARYNEPYTSKDRHIAPNDTWYYPSFHRFHNLNLIFTFRPAPKWSITTRFGFASGLPRSAPGEITRYPVLILPENDGSPFLIEKFKRSSTYSDTLRDGFALPLDVKFSWALFNKKGGKARGEWYIALENCLFFISTRERNETFNDYTGEVDQGSQTASYSIPIVIPSVGFTYSY
ncbi:MAG: TonB-dependent receptor plug domain-containing protein [Spirochaetaceae bacterium]|jgi:hypothetical protein|nr:TonB-dependent receptor plug domain-containing protein [Spirochaetaceae bacterium]